MNDRLPDDVILILASLKECQTELTIQAEKLQLISEKVARLQKPRPSFPILKK